MKIIVGAGGTEQPGWTPLEFDRLDIRQRESWQRLFQPDSLDAVLSEHVLEHLHWHEGERAARNVFEFLRHGGYWRIAVPDAYNPNVSYHLHCSPGGFWQRVIYPLIQNFPNHKEFFSIDSLTDLLTRSGFSVRPIEWFTDQGEFRSTDWSQADGKIYRARGTAYTAKIRPILGFDNISLIVDAIKP